MAMQDNKIVYSSTNDFLHYLTTRKEEKQKENNNRSYFLKASLKKRTNSYRYN